MVALGATSSPPTLGDPTIRKLQQELDELESRMRALREELQKSLEAAAERERLERRGEFLAAYV